MNCKKCNNPLTEGTIFCPICGERVETENITPTAEPAAPIIEPAAPIVTPEPAIEQPVVQQPIIGPTVPEQPVVQQPVIGPTVPEQPAEVLGVEGEVNNAADVVNQTIVTPEPTPIQTAPVYASEPEPKKSKAPLIIGLIVGGVVLIGALIAVFFAVVLPKIKGSGKTTPVVEPDNTPAGYKNFNWTYAKADTDNNTIDIKYNEGIEDTFVVYETYTYKELAQALYDNLQLKDSFGTTHYLDKKMLKKVASIYFISESEYKRFGLLDSKDTFELNWSVIGTLAYEFTTDGFVPESAFYDAETNDYYFYGQIAGEDEDGLQNIGNVALNFGGDQMFTVPCGSYIYWKFNPSNPTTFYLGEDIDDLTAYSTPGFTTMVSYVNAALVKLYE